MFLDDIVITGKTEVIHLQRLNLVLDRLQNHNIRINLEKLKFMMNEIQYCGFTLREDGIHKEKPKMDAIKKCRVPEIFRKLEHL